MKTASWRCGHCIKNPPPFTETHACFVYDPLLAHLIHGLKFAGRLQVVPFFVEEMMLCLKRAYKGRTLPSVLIPVPLQYSRQFKRGFNQAHEIGRRVATALGCSYEPHLVRKRKSTRAQATLNKEARLRNVLGCFEVVGKWQGGSVALIDDVMTTGSTLSELAHTLQRAGATEIHVWVMARARL